MATPMSALRNVYEKFDLADVAAGERIVIQILNANGSQKTLICDAEVPAGDSLTETYVIYSGHLTSV
jgi:hypothetical protein